MNNTTLFICIIRIAAEYMGVGHNIENTKTYLFFFCFLSNLHIIYVYVYVYVYIYIYTVYTFIRHSTMIFNYRFILVAINDYVRDEVTLLLLLISTELVKTSGSYTTTQLRKLVYYKMIIFYYSPTYTNICAYMFICISGFLVCYYIILVNKLKCLNKLRIQGVTYLFDHCNDSCSFQYF